MGSSCSSSGTVIFHTWAKADVFAAKIKEVAASNGGLHSLNGAEEGSFFVDRCERFGDTVELVLSSGRTANLEWQLKLIGDYAEGLDGFEMLNMDMAIYTAGEYREGSPRPEGLV